MALPQSSRMSLRVRFAETDLMGIVHHAGYLVYCEAARVEFLHKRGVSYETWLKSGVHLPVVEANVRYKKPARFDETLIVEARCVEVTRVTVRFDYAVSRDDVLLAEAWTLLACVGDNLAPRRLPPEIAAVFAAAEIAPA